MKILVLASLIIGWVWAWDARQIADSRMCFQLRLDVQVCMFTNSLNNMKKNHELAEKIKDKKAIAKLQQKNDIELKKLCRIWDNLSPASRTFLIEHVAYEEQVMNEDGEIYIDSQPIIYEGDVEEICLSL